MDLTEGKKSWNVWKLESEAFKKPIEIRIWYENKELAEFKNGIEELDKRIKNTAFDVDMNRADIERIREDRRNLVDIVRDQQKQLDEIKEKWNEEVREKKEMYKMIADLKTMVETQSGTILHLQEEMKLIQKKITKVPMVFHDKWFISWRESSGLWMINVPDGDYLLIAKYVVWEHNEFVTNQNELLMDTIHVEGQHYIPFYKLEWGTELDTPTATIYYDLVFIPM